MDPHKIRHNSAPYFVVEVQTEVKILNKIKLMCGALVFPIIMVPSISVYAANEWFMESTVGRVSTHKGQGISFSSDKCCLESNCDVCNTSNS